MEKNLIFGLLVVFYMKCAVGSLLFMVNHWIVYLRMSKRESILEYLKGTHRIWSRLLQIV